MIILSRPINDLGSISLIELPPADKIGIRAGYNRYRLEIPDITLIRIGGTKLINAPIISFLQLKGAGIVSCGTYNRSSGSIVNIVKIITEIYGV